MKGTACRLNLIKLTKILEENSLTQQGRKVHNLLVTLTELQKCAYATEKCRTPRSILRAYNLSFIFGIHCIDLFSQPKINSPRGMFGMPFHALTVHLPETLRLINGRSVVAEQAERQFNSLRCVSVKYLNFKQLKLFQNR